MLRMNDVEAKDSYFQFFGEGEMEYQFFDISKYYQYDTVPEFSPGNFLTT